MRAPYPGLRAFRRSESDLFFGRDGCIDEMVDRLAETRFLAVLGASGSGKSSLVRTGLMDALDLGFNVRAGSDWLVADMHPGADPMDALAGALLAAKGGEHSSLDRQLLSDLLRRGPFSLAEWCLAGHLPEGQNLLVLVDQFEELFRYGDYGERETAEGFVEMLLESASTDKAPISIIITMRSEFLSACTLFSGLAERINRGLYLTPRMSRDECREAIMGPAAVCGFSVTPGLVNRVLNDMGSFAPWEEPGGTDQVERLSKRADQLPLMQHVLNLMWLRAGETPGPIELTEPDYDKLKGLKGALDEHGDQLLLRLGPEGAATAETVFRALVVGTTPSTAVRQPTRIAELTELAHGDADGVASVVESFRALDCNFLQPPPDIPLGPATIVDLSHESLIRQWSRLAEWTSAQARSTDYWQRLDAAAERHQKGEGELLYGLDLAMFSAWWDEEQPTPAWARRNGGDYDRAAAFLAASRARHDEAERARLDAEARETRGLRRRAAIWGGVALLTTASTAAAALMWNTAETQKTKAEASAIKAKDQEALALKASREATRSQGIAEQATRVAKIERDHTRDAFEQANRHKKIAEARLIAQQSAQRSLLDQRAKTAAALVDRERSKNDALAALLEAERQKNEAEQQRDDAREARRERDEMRRAEQARQEKLEEAVALGEITPSTFNKITGGTEAQATEVASGSSISARPGPADGDGDRDSASNIRMSPASGSAALDQPIDAATLAQARASVPEQPDPVTRARARALYERLAQSYEVALRKVEAAGAGARREDADEFVRLADEYAWFNLDIDDRARADAAVAALGRVAARLPSSLGATKSMALASAAYLDAERAHQQGDVERAKALEAESDRLAGQIAADGDASETALRFAFRVKRYMANLADKDLPLRRERLAQACAIADRLLSSGSGGSRAVRLKGRCLAERASLAEAEGRRDEFARHFTEAVDLAERALQRSPTDQWLHATVLDAAINLSWFFDKGGGDPPPPGSDPEQRDRWRRRAVDAFVAGFADQPVEGGNLNLVRDAYDEIARTQFPDRAGEIAFFVKVGSVVAPGAEAFPKSPLGFVLADSRRRVGEALSRDPPDRDLARRFLESAVAGYRRGGFLLNLARNYSKVPLPAFSELPARVCATSQRLAKLLAQTGEFDSAKATHEQMLSDCQPALNAYPYDFYLRMPMLNSYAELGISLAKSGRGAEARPLLEYASHWGDGDATRELAALYTAGSGVPADPAKAESLTALAKGQTMKRFTVPSDFNGNNFPLQVYVRAWPPEYSTTLKLRGIDDQATWVKEARGGTVSQEVRDAFIKLQEIAIANDVSFPDLAEYALITSAGSDSASNPTSTATRADAAAIAAAIQRQNFTRNSEIDSDSAGVALRGFDPVSYQRRGPKAGDPGIFALWKGAIWLFSNESNRKRFLADPERFAPAFGGYCATCLAVGNRVSSDTQIFAIVDGRLLLFSSEERRRVWLDTPSQHLKTANRLWDELRRDEAKPAPDTNLGQMIAEALAPD